MLLLKKRLIKMASTKPAFESAATYYNSPSKLWITGTFSLTDKYIQFYSEDQEIINLKLTAVSGIEKKQSSFIYSAIVISVASDKHWFASFSNRDGVYNLIELFWRESLLSKEHKTVSPRPNSGSTNLGKDLLNLLHESETTLVNAANSLSDQGRQIEETQGTVEDINADLNVAEKFIKNMSFTQSLMQLASSSRALDKQEQQKCFKVSFTFSEKENCSWNAGTLFVGENVSIVEENKVEQLSVNYDDITSIEVISSWKLCLKYCTDNSDKSCYIMCPKLEKLMKFLSSLSSINAKIFYLENTNFNPSTLPTSLTGSCSSSSLSQSTSSRHNNLDSQNAQMQESEIMMSDEDIQEISSMLNSLQDLASGISREQKSQMEKIESLMSNVERTELRMKADSKKIKKLT